MSEHDKTTRYDIKPVAKPRMTQRDKWKKSTAKYWAFKAEVRLKKVKFDNGYSVTFGVPMAKSWGKKKKAEHNNNPNLQVPDIDNYLKALLDSIFDDDSHIWHIGELKKLWSYTGYIEITEAI